MKTKFLTLFILPTILLFSSCKKKCNVENVTSNEGAIIEDVVIYPKSGFMTESMFGNYAIGANHNYANQFELSFKGSDKVAVNYANYKILANPVTANCKAAYKRNVTIDNANQTVNYTVTVEQCKSCDYEVTSENYVLVPTFPDNYTVNFVIDKKDIE